MERYQLQLTKRGQGLGELMGENEVEQVGGEATSHESPIAMSARVTIIR